MKLFPSIATAAVIGTSFITANPAEAKPSYCKFEGTPVAKCSLNIKVHTGGWSNEWLEEPNGTLRIISRQIRGEGVQINLYAPGQKRGSFHQGTYSKSGNKITIYVDGGTFDYTY